MSAEDRYRELVPLAALDALDGEDAVEFREHLATCADCRAELAAYAEVAGTIGAGVKPVPPPLGLRDRVLAAAGAASIRPARPPRSRPFLWVGTLATAATVALALVLLVTRGQLRQERERAAALAADAEQARRELADLQQVLAEARSVRDLVAHPDSRLTILAGLQPAPGARARVVWNASTREAVLIASGLRRPPEGQAYEVWVIGEANRPVPAGVFQPAGDGTALVRLPRVEETARPRTFAVTLEPAAGSASPTGPMVLAGAVS
jgi:anti-sigma-K factor RskA